MDESAKKPDDASIKLAVHGLFAKVQEKTGLGDNKIDEFQKKWLEIPETRTKYKHWWDAPAIGGEELYAMFNDIIDFVQAQEVGQSHVFSSLRKESEEILKDPETYFQHLVGLGKGWMERGMGWAKSWMGHGNAVGATPGAVKAEASPMEKAEKEELEPPEEELSDFEKAELEDRKEEESEGDEIEEVDKKEEEVVERAEKKPAKKPAKAKAKATASKTKKASAKKKAD